MKKYNGVMPILGVLVLVGLVLFLSWKTGLRSGGTAVINPSVSNVAGDIAAGDAATGYTDIPITSGVSTGFVLNQSPYTRFIVEGSIVMSGNASATPYRLYIATSTSATTQEAGAGGGTSTPLFAALGYGGLLNGWKMASSTVATTTSLTDGPRGYNGNIIPWKSGEYIAVVLQVDEGTAAYSELCPTRTGLGFCEAATSTARGFNLDFVFRSFATSTYR